MLHLSATPPAPLLSPSSSAHATPIALPDVALTRRQRKIGLSLAVFGMAIGTPDPCALRVAQSLCNNSTLILLSWRFAAITAVNVAFTCLQRGGPVRAFASLAAAPGLAGLVALFQMGMQIGFAASLLLAEPAKALLLIW